MLEMIIFQVAENDREDFESLMEELATEMSRKQHEVEMALYRHAALSTDVCILLKSKAGPQSSNITRMGLRLAASLKSLGLVDHTRWVEWITCAHHETSS